MLRGEGRRWDRGLVVSEDGWGESQATGTMCFEIWGQEDAWFYLSFLAPAQSSSVGGTATRCSRCPQRLLRLRS